MRLRAALAAASFVVTLAPSPVAHAHAPIWAEPAAHVSPSATDDQAPAGAGPADPSLPGSVHYEDTLAHAGDRTPFAPGGVVTRPFVPRTDDPWLVAGRAARALPPGRASGRQLLAQPNGSVALRPEPVRHGTARLAPLAPPSASAALTSAGTDAGIDDANATIATSNSATAIDPQAVVGDRLRREVFGFLPYWELSSSSLRLDYSTLSTIAYFGVGADSNGHLIKQNSDGTPSTGWAGWTSARMTQVLNDAHAARTRVVLTIQRFSWTSSQASATATLLSNATYRQTLANEIATAVRDRGADGVNLDFEPIPTGQGANFVTLVRQVRAALDARALGYQLTFDATGYVGNYDVAALTARGAADAVLVMGYDYRTGSANWAGSIAPLGGPAYDLTETLRAFLARTSPSKVILGLPYYGRAWSTVSSAPNAPTRPQGSTYGTSSAVPYETAADLVATYGRRYDSLEQSAWTAYTRRNCDTCPSTWRELYYDDTQSLGMKYDFVNYSDLRGVGMWALGYDGTRPELYALLKTKFVNDRTRPLAGIVNMAPTSHNEGIAVDWSAVDDYTGITFYDVQVSVDGGAWAPWLTGTRAGSATYVGRTGHGYAFRVRAMDGVGNWSLWNVGSRWQATPVLAPGGFASVATSSLTMRSAPTTSAGGVGTLAADDIVAITAGPVEADGFTWYQATGPLHEWGTVDWATSRGFWVAAGDGADTYLAAQQSPNAVGIDADIAGLSTGAVHLATLTSATSAGSLASSTRTFSPNRDGTLDALRLTYTLTRPLDTLTLRAYAASTRALAGERTLPGITDGRHAYDWDGTIGGTRLADGQYVVQLVGARDGATYAAPAADMRDRLLPASYTVTVDTVAPTIGTLIATAGRFSPNGDGAKDYTDVSASTSGNAVRWAAEVYNGATAIRSFSGTGRTPWFRWNGRDAQGNRVPDGSYGVRVRVWDAVGNVRAANRTLVVDTVAPTGFAKIVVPGLPLGATWNSFSPDGDGMFDSAQLTWRASESVSGRIAIRSSRGPVWWRSISAASGYVWWNGRHADGRSLPDGTYLMIAYVSDAAGNAARYSSYVNLNRTATWGGGSRLFYPTDGDAFAATATFSFRLSNTAYTTIRVAGEDGIIRNGWIRKLQVAGRYRWTWDGRDASGSLVPAGHYRIQLIAARNGRTQIFEHGVTVNAFVTYPSATLLNAGDRLTVAVRSAEPLSGAPTVSLQQTGLEPVQAVAAPLPDGRWTATFTIQPGPGRATLTVTGEDTAGGVNESVRPIVIV